MVDIKNSTTEFESSVIDEIRHRRSRRALDTRVVEPEKIRSLFEAARWAPSSMNEQPWTYVYTTLDQPELHESVLQSLNPSNQVWARQAPLFIVSMVRKQYSRNQALNTAALYDLGSANAFLSLQATHDGLIVHQIGGFDRQRIQEVLRIPDAYEVVLVMAVGYPGDPDALPENLRVRELAPRVRFSQQTFVRNTPFQ